MAENLELEAAEIELRKSFELEPQRRKHQLAEISRIAGTSLTFGDIIIGLTAVIFLIGSLCSLIASIFALMDTPNGMLWISLLPTALCSLGIGLALFRVLGMTMKVKDTTDNQEKTDNI
jgi:hypothetical protein